MSKRKVTFALAAILLSFAAGVAYLFNLMLDEGSVYPPYSSLRADPLGTGVFYESLQGMGLRLGRNYDSLSLFRQGKDTTLVLAGSDGLPSLSARQMKGLEQFLASGGRLVICLSALEKSDRERSGTAHSHTGEPSSRPATRSASAPVDWPVASDESTTAENAYPDLRATWGVSVMATNGKAGKDALAKPMASGPAQAAFKPLAWRGDWHFANLREAWHVLYVVGNKPVIVERRWGAGSIVLAGDSYFVSNEAMKSDRCPALLAYLVGDSVRVTFDETHLGLVREIGVAALMRKYHLEGVLACLLVLAALFVWKCMAPFGPRLESDATNHAVEGRQSDQGLVNLIHRSVEPKKLLDVCEQEWLKSQPHGSTKLSQEAQATSAATSKKDIVNRYRNICISLSRQKHMKGRL